MEICYDPDEVQLLAPPTCSLRTQALLAALALGGTAGRQQPSWAATSTPTTEVVRQEYDQYAGACARTKTITSSKAASPCEHSDARPHMIAYMSEMVGVGVATSTTKHYTRERRTASEASHERHQNLPRRRVRCSRRRRCGRGLRHPSAAPAASQQSARRRARGPRRSGIIGSNVPSSPLTRCISELAGTQ